MKGPFFAALAAALFALAGVADAQSLRGVRKEFIAVGEKVIPATVTVRSPESRLPNNMGSTGVIIHRDGYVLSDADATLMNIVRKEDGTFEKSHGVDAVVKLPAPDHRSFRAIVVLRDQDTDTTLLKITEPVKGRLPVVPIGSSDSLSVGSFTFVCGNAFGLGKEAEPALSLGVLAGTDENDVKEGGRFKMLYTSAAVNPGSNGGPCVDVEGRLVGIVSTFETSEQSPYRALGKVTPVDLLRIPYEGVEGYDKIFPDPKSLTARSDQAAILEDAFGIIARHARKSLVSLVVDRGDAKATWTMKVPARGSDGRVRLVDREIPRYVGPYSGVVISEEGLILTSTTNLWSFTEIKSITAHLADGTAVPAKVLGRDRKRGIALLSVEVEGLVPLPRAEKGDIAVGRIALTMSDPSGEAQSDVPLLTFGIVSGLHRLTRMMDAVQTDAGMNDAMAGGALVSLDGRLLGINILVATERYGRNTGIGFAIPLSSIVKTLDRLKAGEDVLPADMAARITKAKDGVGLVFVQVRPGGPAGKAGLKNGDRLLSADGKTIVEFPTPAEFNDHLLEKEAGQILELIVQRGEETLTIPVPLEVRKQR